MTHYKANCPNCGKNSKVEWSHLNTRTGHMFYCCACGCKIPHCRVNVMERNKVVSESVV